MSEFAKLMRRCWHLQMTRLPEMCAHKHPEPNIESDAETGLPILSWFSRQNEAVITLWIEDGLTRLSWLSRSVSGEIPDPTDDEIVEKLRLL